MSAPCVVALGAISTAWSMLAASRVETANDLRRPDGGRSGGDGRAGTLEEIRRPVDLGVADPGGVGASLVLERVVARREHRPVGQQQGDRVIAAEALLGRSHAPLAGARVVQLHGLQRGVVAVGPGGAQLVVRGASRAASDRHHRPVGQQDGVPVRATDGLGRGCPPAASAVGGHRRGGGDRARDPPFDERGVVVAAELQHSGAAWKQHRIAADAVPAAGQAAEVAPGEAARVEQRGVVGARAGQEHLAGRREEEMRVQPRGSVPARDPLRRQALSVAVGVVGRRQIAMRPHLELGVVLGCPRARCTRRGLPRGHSGARPDRGTSAHGAGRAADARSR